MPTCMTLSMGSHLVRGAPLNCSQAKKIGGDECFSTDQLTNGWALKAADMK